MNKKELAKFVGSRIKENRKRNKLTQKELGEKIGVKDNTVSAYERGAISPEQDMLFAISDVLGISINELFPKKENTRDEFENALKLANNLDIEDMEFLNKLIEKTLSMDEKEREKFLESIRFTVEYYENLNKN
ncbi:helix-turn-helix domain-containing protein [Oceanobacillus sp. FSL W7-1293]|uniref:helix-turn-helix domain-containing protein n=1 Tax=Oceanobacillus sp. FSL W7-1293 TaxID=2921699 RepID=UPI0030D5BBAF